MSSVIKAISSLAVTTDVPVQTNIPGVRVFKGITHAQHKAVFYQPGICILLQGRKKVSLGGVRFPYDADNYLIVSVDVPMEAEVVASADAPVIGMVIDIDMAVLHELISITGHSHGTQERNHLGHPKAVEPVRMDAAMRGTVERMSGSLLSRIEAQALGAGLVREVMYRALCGPQSAALFALANHGGAFSRIAHVLRLIQTRYAEKLDVEFLAAEARMGVSAFHQSFKEVTSESPMQYLKKVRLTKARELLLQDREKVYRAAGSVGYESTSQFSREFKRHFGEAPSAVSRL